MNSQQQFCTLCQIQLNKSDLANHQNSQNHCIQLMRLQQQMQFQQQMLLQEQMLLQQEQARRAFPNYSYQSIGQPIGSAWYGSQIYQTPATGYYQTGYDYRPLVPPTGIAYDVNSKENVHGSQNSNVIENIGQSNINDDNKCGLEPEISYVNGQKYSKFCNFSENNEGEMKQHVDSKPKKEIQRDSKFACNICNIELSSEATLQSHLQGMAHIKRSQVAVDAQKEVKCQNETFPYDKANLHELREHFKKLKTRNFNLKHQVNSLQKFKQECLSSHKDVKPEYVKMSELGNSTITDDIVSVE